MNRTVRVIQVVILGSRWLVVPFLLGLIVGLAVVLYKFGIKLVEFAMQAGTADPSDVLVASSISSI
jgi:uncharacterized membrane protein YqhA